MRWPDFLMAPQATTGALDPCGSPSLILCCPPPPTHTNAHAHHLAPEEVAGFPADGSGSWVIGLGPVSEKAFGALVAQGLHCHFLILDTEGGVAPQDDSWGLFGRFLPLRLYSGSSVSQNVQKGKRLGPILLLQPGPEGDQIAWTTMKGQTHSSSPPGFCTRSRTTDGWPFYTPFYP